ncbi:hypothetical protein F4810DRAFT_510352 [Camillea tinctor]|nr:hypothetical protein F4810DRAFT_510352 [Camillea tinctor]
MEFTTQPPSVSHGTYLKIQITLDIVVAAFVAIRLFTNYRYSRKLTTDDYFSVVAVVVLAGYSSSSFLMTRAFVSTYTTISTITRISVACLFTGGAAMYFAKTPLILLYIRLFGIHQWLRVSCYLLLTVTAVIYLVCAIYSGVNCISHDGNYDTPFLLRCMTNTFIPALCRCFTSIITDILILLLPLPVVAKLHLPRARKIGLMIVFMTGIFAIVAGCVSLYYQWKMKQSSNASDMTVAIVTTKSRGFMY